MSSNFWFTEEQFRKINPLLPVKPRGVPCVDDRKVLSGIIFCIKRVYRWSDVPSEYGSVKTPHNRWKCWSEAGVFANVFDALVRETADLSTLMIDLARTARCNSSTTSTSIKRATSWNACLIASKAGDS